MSSTVVRFVRTGGPADAPVPVPADRELPEWFRTLRQSLEDLPIPADKTAKLCMPLNDAMRLGWLLRAPRDLRLRRTDDGVRVDAGGDGVTVLDPDQPDRDRNSAFFLPEVLVSTPWAVDPPADYETLVTQPLNRDELRFTVADMLVDECEGGLAVPLYLEREAVEIGAGEPIAQVVPVAREDLARGVETHPFEADPTLAKQRLKTARASNRRKDVYRTEAWVPKESPRIVDDPGAVADGDGGPDAADGPAADGPLQYFCPDDRYGDLPPPAPAEEFVPDWYAERLRAVEGLDADQPTSEWIRAATAAGAVVPLPGRLSVSRNPDATPGEEPLLDVDAEGPTDHHLQHPLKLGEDHPAAPAAVLNINSEWTVAPPDGASVLVSHPLAQFQRYYRSYAGLADFDRYPTTANAPGLVTDRADEWTFPARTPVAQHLPIDRATLPTVATVDE